MPKPSVVVPFSSSAPVSTVVLSYPQACTAGWRREMAECHSYYDALSLVYRIIRQVERQELVEREKFDRDQLAFPWARAAD